MSEIVPFHPAPAINEPIDIRNGHQILSRATADELRPGLWQINVEGGWAKDYQSENWPTYRRSYMIETLSDDEAAFIGLASFEAEIGNLVE